MPSSREASRRKAEYRYYYDEDYVRLNGAGCALDLVAHDL
jgi:hypothetical protein